MTTDQIKALAKQAGGTTMGDMLMIFKLDGLAEFVRLVRESALDEAATQCRQLADCEENTEGYRNGAAWCVERIGALK